MKRLKTGSSKDVHSIKDASNSRYYISLDPRKPMTVRTSATTKSVATAELAGLLWNTSNSSIASRETRNGWLLLTVESEMNGDSNNTNERGHSLVGSLGSSFVLPRLFCRPSTTIFSSTYGGFIKDEYYS
jgi:hypothetical protein